MFLCPFDLNNSDKKWLDVDVREVVKELSAVQECMSIHLGGNGPISIQHVEGELSVEVGL